MPSKRVSATALGEASLAQLAMRLLDHNHLTTRDLGRGDQEGRHLWIRQSQLRHGNALVDLVAVTENFVTRRLLEFWPGVTESEVSTWKKREYAWRNHANVDLTIITPDWHNLLGFVEARNALQHGLGRLTEMQLGRHRDDVLSDLAAANISLIGDLIQIDVHTVRSCYSVCENFVVTLDNAAQNV
jgi:hypothetical protein